MPRIRQKANIYRAEDFAKAVKGQLVFLGLQQHDLAMELNISDGMMSQLLKNPDKFSAGRLRKTVQYLQMPPESLLVFCGYEQKSIKKQSR